MCDVSLQEIADITADDAASFSKYQMLWLLHNHAGSDALRVHSGELIQRGLVVGLVVWVVPEPVGAGHAVPTAVEGRARPGRPGLRRASAGRLAQGSIRGVFGRNSQRPERTATVGHRPWPRPMVVCEPYNCSNRPVFDGCPRYVHWHDRRGARGVRAPPLTAHAPALRTIWSPIDGPLAPRAADATAAGLHAHDTRIDDRQTP